MKKLTLSIFIAAHCVAQAASITNISHGVGTSGQYEVVFKDADILPNTFVTRSPNSLVLDFPGTDLSFSQREVTIASNGIYDVDILEGGGKTRAVINLAAIGDYQVVRRGKDIAVLFASSGVPTASSSTATPVQSGNSNMPVQNGNASLGSLFNVNGSPSASSTYQGASSAQALNPSTLTQSSSNLSTQKTTSIATKFVKKNARTGMVSFSLPPAYNDVAVRQDGNKVVATINGFYVDKRDEKRIEVGSYGTVVNSVDVYRTARGTDVVLHIKRNQAFEFVSYQNGGVYTIEVTKPAQDMSFQKELQDLQGFGSGKSYNGQPLSLNFQDIEVRAVLQIIAEFTDKNIVVSDAVVGNITLRLDNVPWDQALDIILKTKGLGMRKSGSVIYVAPASELDENELNALTKIQKQNQLIPSTTQMIQMKYANAADIAELIEKSRENNMGRGDREAVFQDSILSAKGTVSVDVRTNTLLVSDIPSKIQSIRDLVAKLDEPIRQVLVDARLVLTSDSYQRQLGSKFGISFFNSGNDAVVAGSGTAQGATAIADSVGAGNNKVTAPDLNSRLGVNLPSSNALNNPGSSYGLAILGADFLVDLELSALQTEGLAEVVSSPRVVTQDGKKARIASGTEIPYQVQTADGMSTEFKKAELSLDVTPRIAPDNRVDMVLDIKRDSPNEGVRVADGIGINTNHLETNVLVDNGETIVLGGIYEQDQSVNSSKVPFFGDLPIVGNAFKTTSKNYNKSELLIFVTPRIVDRQLTDYDKFSNIR